MTIGLDSYYFEKEGISIRYINLGSSMLFLKFMEQKIQFIIDIEKMIFH